MLELIIKKDTTNKIALVENGRLVEYYEDSEKQNRNEGNIYIGTVEDIVEGMQAAFVNIGTDKNSFIHIKDILPKVDEKNEKWDDSKNIKDIIKVKDKIVVQVRKDSNDTKGARVSTHINLPSKFIVLMPNTSIITISKKIEKEDERQRLQNIIKENLPENMGAIIRTSAEGQEEKELLQDIQYITTVWKKIQEKYNKHNRNGTCLIYKSPNIVEKIMIDMFSKGLENIYANDKNEYQKLVDIQRENESFKNFKIVLDEQSDILDKYELKKEIEKINSRKIWLKCGGFITIDKTEALTAIDVNTGKYTGKKSLEDTILKVNEEATYEIAKQVRLRDIGGIIIVDYIDMLNTKHKDKIEALLKERLKLDRAKTQVEGFTKLDLMEFTRKHICSHKS